MSVGAGPAWGLSFEPGVRFGFRIFATVLREFSLVADGTDRASVYRPDIAAIYLPDAFACRLRPVAAGLASVCKQARFWRLSLAASPLWASLWIPHAVWRSPGPERLVPLWGEYQPSRHLAAAVS